MLYQSTLYNLLSLQQQITDLRRIQYHSTLSLGKLDDTLLSNIWNHHFSTQFSHYDHFLIKHKSIPSVNNSNRRCNNTEIYHCGRFVPKQETERCITWTNATNLELFQHTHLVLPTFHNRTFSHKLGNWLVVLYGK